jgi:hypothetical protein
MTIPETAPALVNSTLLANVLYDVGESILQLEFCNGAIYRYFAVPAAIHDGLLIADSKGSYFNRKIRSDFRYVRIRRPR